MSRSRRNTKIPEKAYQNLIDNGATEEEAEFISEGQRVELNMFTSLNLIRYVEAKLQEYEVTKVVPDEETLQQAWVRAHHAIRINAFIRHTRGESNGKLPDLDAPVPPIPRDLATRVRKAFKEDDTQTWDKIVWDLAANHQP